MVGSYAGLGHAGGIIGFTNRSSTTCRLTGWPTLVALSNTGRTATALHEAGELQGHLMPEHPRIPALPSVILRPGQRADAVFGGTDNPDLHGTRCRSFIRYLRVTPPGNAHSVVLSAWIGWLGGYLPACQRIGVSMVVPRSDLYHG